MTEIIKNTEPRKIEINSHFIEVRGNGHVKTTAKAKSAQIADIKELEVIFKELSNDKPNILLIIDPTEQHFPKIKARNYGFNFLPKYVKAAAIIIKNPVAKMIVNFMLKIKITPIKIKEVKTEEEAVKWLTELKNRESL